MNTTAVDGLSSIYLCIGRVKLYTSNPGGKYLQYLRMIRYCIDVGRDRDMETKSQKNTRVIQACMLRLKGEPVDSIIAKALQLAIDLNASDLESPRDLSPEGYRIGHRQLVAYLRQLNATYLQ